MSVVDKIIAFFAFSTRPVTVLTLLSYAAIFIATIWVHEVPVSPPARISKQLGLDLDTAWRDLQIITSYPHPYNSHENDRVRSHILDRVKGAAKGTSYVHVGDDNLSNATYASSAQVVYFEGTNILVKIDGKDGRDDHGVLFSAHYDSVSTAPGATDDGMGTVTLLQLVDYYAKNQPQKTVIFNINNGEEDWLNGAHALLEHPWAKIPKVFLNLEGAGNAGRPLLFRTSSTGVTAAYRAAHHPHGTVITADAFKRGAVRSGTDFSVYEQFGLKGLDLAFYRKRSRYHTKYDSVAALSGKSSLWVMMENSVRTGNALVALKDGKEDGGAVVYFDLFGTAMVVLSQKWMLIINVLLLVFGPIITLGAAVLLRRKDKLLWDRDAWFRFPLALVVSGGATYGLAVITSKLSPYIVYSSSYSVLAALMGIAYLSMYGVLRSLHVYRPLSGTETSQRSVIILETYILWWAFLVFDTAVLNTKAVGGLYFFTFYHAGGLSALLLVLLELAVAQDGRNKLAHADNGDAENGHDTEPTERTPLIPPEAEERGVRDLKWMQPLWGLEFIVTAVFPTILTSQLLLVLLTALPQTLSDGNSTLTIYILIATLSLLILLPLAPFIHKVHRIFSFVLIGILIITVCYNLLAFPFSPANPLKIYFQQTMDLDSAPNGSNNTVELVAIPGYLQKYIVPSTPSGDDALRSGEVHCSSAGERKLGLTSCRFPGLTPNVAPSTTRGSDITTSAAIAKAELLKVNSTRLTAGSGVITIKGQNSRSCRIYFDHPVTAVSVKGGDDRVQDGYAFPEGGLKEARVWSRTWDRTFEVIVNWDVEVEEGDFGGRVSCNWSEMRSERIPALDEQISFIPTWAVVSKLTDGLVEGFKRFKM